MCNYYKSLKCQANRPGPKIILCNILKLTSQTSFFKFLGYRNIHECIVILFLVCLK